MTVRVIPLTVTVIVPVRSAVVFVFAVTLILNEPLPVRLAGLMLEAVSHLELLMGALHVVLDATLIVIVSASAPGIHVVGDSVRVFPVFPAACVTQTVLVIPSTVTVTVPDRLAPVLAVALIRKEPLPLRLEGLILVMVSQPTLLLGELQVVLDVTIIVVLAAVGPGFHVKGNSDRILLPACATTTVRVISLAVTVM